MQENNNPHPVDEDPEDHLGEELPDPWDDPTQTDWKSGNDEEVNG